MRIMIHLCFAVLLIGITMTNFAETTALDDYIAKPDPHYAWRVVDQQHFEAGNVYWLNLTSQAWRTDQDVDQPIWWHWLVLYVPVQVQHTTALLRIGASENSSNPPNPSESLGDLAIDTHSITAELLYVPNQPLVFLADEQLRPRREDHLLAFGMKQYLRTNDPEWLAHLPMTKSVVRAMDVIAEFCSLREGRLVTSFVLAGSSKRGWTTWLTAAVDKRVVAIAPCVFDNLNQRLSMQHHFNAYGTYSQAVTPYVENGIMDLLDTPEAETMQAVIDPYAYRERLTLPKLIMNSTGDQFFLPDSSQFYYADLIGPKYLRYLPNTDHSLDASGSETLRSFYMAILSQAEFPSFSWQIPVPGTMIVETKTQPTAVHLWQAHNPENRDFRLETIGSAWEMTPLEPIETTAGHVRYEVNLLPPEQGWIAFLVEVTFPDPVDAERSLTLTTEVSVIPNTLPHEKK